MLLSKALARCQEQSAKMSKLGKIFFLLLGKMFYAIWKLIYFRHRSTFSSFTLVQFSFLKENLFLWIDLSNDKLIIFSSQAEEMKKKSCCIRDGFSVLPHSWHWLISLLPHSQYYPILVEPHSWYEPVFSGITLARWQYELKQDQNLSGASCL